VIKEHNIKVEKSAIMPFNERIERMCRLQNAFLTYKLKRQVILADKDNGNDEPFHLRMLKQMKEEEKKKQL